MEAISREMTVSSKVSSFMPPTLAQPGSTSPRRARAAGAALDVPGLQRVVRGMVSDVARRHDEDHVLRDVRGVVSDALEVAGYQDQIQRRLNGGRILQHVGEQLPENLGFEI